MTKNSLTRIGFIVAAIGAWLPFTAHYVTAATYTWKADVSGNWATTANWNPSTGFPNAIDDVAGLTFNITAARTVTLDAPATIGTLNIGDSGSSYRAYTLTGSNTLTFDVTTGNATISRPTSANTQTDIIDVPVQLNDPLSINYTATNGGLKFQKTIGGNQSITIGDTSTSTGTVRAVTTFTTANTYTGQTIITSMPATAAPGTSRNVLIIQDAAGLGTTAGNTVVQGGPAGGRLELDGNFTTNEPIDLGGDNTAIATILTNLTARLVGGSSETDGTSNEISGNITTSTGGGANYMLRADGGSNNSTFTISGNITKTDGAAGTLILGAASNGGFDGAGVISGTIGESSGTWDVYKGNAGSWTLSGNNSYSGTTTVAQGVLLVGNNGATGNLGAGDVNLTDASANNGGLVFNRSDAAYVVNNTITGTGNIHQANSSGGTVTLAGANTYQGYTHIYQGNIIITNASSLGSATGAGGNGAGGYTEIYDPTDDATRGSLQIGNNVTTPEVLYLDTHTTNDANTAHVYSLSGSNSGVSGVISNDLPEGAYFDDNWKYYTFQANSNSTLTLSGDIRQDVAGLAAVLTLRGAGNGTVSGNIIEPTTSYYHNAAISGNSWSLVKNGGGTWTLSGNNTYTGTTEVAGGTLRVDGNNSGTGTVTVDSGAALGGIGTIAGPVIVAGTISPGDSPGTLTVASLDMSSGSSGLFELMNTPGNHSGSGNDLVAVTGGLTLPGSGLTFNVSAIGGGLLSAAGTWELMSYGSLTGTLGSYSLTGVDTANYSAVVSAGSGFNGNGVYLTLTPVPEPSTFILAGFGIVGLCLARRRYFNHERKATR